MFLVQDILRSAPQSSPCLIDRRVITYGELDLISSSVGSMLRESGVRVGDRVVIFLPNSWQFAAIFFGVLKAGAIATLVDFRSSQRELEFHLADSKPSFAFVESSKEEWVSSALNSLEAIDTSKDAFPALPSKTAPKYETAINPESVACIVYTGGTTGKSKGAMLTHKNFEAVLSGLGESWALRRNRETFVQIIPMTHSGGLNCIMNCSMFVGGATVIVRKFEANTFFELVEKHGITILVGVPSIYSRLANDTINLSNRDLRTLRICFCSGAPLPAEIASRFEAKTGKKITVGWGLTEASPQLTVSPAGVFKPNYVGVPISKGTHVVTLDEAGRVNDEGMEGELGAKGPQVMKGYWNNEAETSLTFTKDGYLRTGDVGIVLKDGVYVYGRKKDLINSGGYKIWPHEVESVLMESPDVLEAAVVGVPDSEYVEAVKAVVVRARSSLTEVELKGFCRDKLAGYKIPKYFEFVDSLPKSSVGKILHRRLKETDNQRRSSPKDSAG